MTYLDKLLKAMKYKNDVVRKYTGLNLFYEKDFKTMSVWNEESIFFIINSIIELHTGDDKICPFCIKYNNGCWMRCGICEYAKLHGTCNIDICAQYDKVVKKLRRLHNISKMVYIPELVNNMIKILKSGEDI
jgi:hypothetical protein